MRNLVLQVEQAFEQTFNDSGEGNERARDLSYNFEEVTNEIIDLRKLISDKVSKNEKFCSFELVPVRNGYEIYRRLLGATRKYEPLYYALTWHAKSVKSCALGQEMRTFPRNTLLHIAAGNLKSDDVEAILKDALACGITNIFALRGDAKIEGDFPHAVDLVNFVRNRYSMKFSICVAGYPQMHPNSTSKDSDLFYLKEKVDAGADFIITQIFFESYIFINFVNDCRKIGITIPIIPGIFPISHYASLERMANACRVNVPKALFTKLQSLKNNDKAFYNFTVKLTADIINDIIDSGTACGFHFFTLNRVSPSVDICDRVGFAGSL